MIVNDAHQMTMNKNMSKLLKFPINNVNITAHNNISKKNNFNNGSACWHFRMFFTRTVS